MIFHGQMFPLWQAHVDTWPARWVKFVSLKLSIPPAGFDYVVPGGVVSPVAPAGFALKDTPVIVGVAADSGCGKWLYGDF